MRYWFTPFPLSETVCSSLTAAGFLPWQGGDTSLPDADALLLYDSPDQLIAMAGTGPDKVELSAQILLQGYRRLLLWSERTGQPLLSISQLQRLGPQVLGNWFADGDYPSLPPAQPLPIPPLLASVTLSLLEAEPALLDCYSDLELRAVLLGRDPDFRYQERLRHDVLGAEVLLQAFLTNQGRLAAALELEQRLASMDTELQGAREAAELSLLQLHQVQEELDHCLLADGEKQRQLEAGVRIFEELRLSKAAQETAHELELKTLRERQESRLAELDQRLASSDSELKEAREAGELSLLQLHQVQEELEHYFLADGEKRRQLEAGVRIFEELRLSKAPQETAHELELKTLRERLEPRLAELDQRLASSDSELKEAREAAELSLLQLQQMQEELEHYFLRARASDQLAQAQLEQLQRAQALMVRLQPDVLPTAPSHRALAVEVLPEIVPTKQDTTLQTKALLNTYAASLQRASSLLERASRS